MKLSARYFAALAFAATLGGSPARASIIVFDASLDSAQVVAGGGSTSTAMGTGKVFVDTTLFTVTTDLIWSGLTGPADRAHLHNAAPGETTDARFEHELFGADGSAARTQACSYSPYYNFCAPARGSIHDVGDATSLSFLVLGLPDFNAMLADFLQNGMYIDIHTQLYPLGEIRGQLIEEVPEPATMGLLLLGLAAIAVSARYRRRESNPLARAAHTS
jgi:hypothetical protein